MAKVLICLRVCVILVLSLVNLVRSLLQIVLFV